MSSSLSSESESGRSLVRSMVPVACIAFVTAGAFDRGAFVAYSDPLAIVAEGAAAALEKEARAAMGADARGGAEAVLLADISCVGLETAEGAL